MEKEQNLTGWTWHKQQHEAMFRASYQHVTGTYNSKLRHGMNLLKALTDHKPKRIGKYNDTHVNIASFVNRFQQTKHGIDIITKASS